MERKLLRLALSPSAHGGEITTSATKLINALRTRGVESSTIENALESSNDTEDVTPRHLQAGLGARANALGQTQGVAADGHSALVLAVGSANVGTGYAGAGGIA